MTINRMNRRGFTLIELLVVITIIAILATVATPMMSKVQVRARMVPATKNAQSILQALTLYKGDSGGIFPEGVESSNDAFRTMFPDVCDNEKMFYLKGDRVFCDPKVAPDEEIGEKNGEENGAALEAGENHWAYVSGLSDNNKSTTPIIADGFTGNTLGTYDEKNHVWAQPKKAIVGFIDGSATAMRVRNGVVQSDGKKGQNIFESEAIVDDEFVAILNPLKRARPTAAQ